MPIEFRCTQCDRLLRTQDQTAGKKAKCPECGAILTIPVPGAPSEPTEPWEAAPPPQAGPEPAPAVPPPGGGPQSPFGPIEPPAPGPESPPASGTAPDAENPYASPADYAVGAPVAYAAPTGRIVPTQIDFGEVFSRTWMIFKQRLGISIAVFMIFLALSLAVGIGIGIVRGIVTFAAGDPVTGILVGLFLQLFGWLFNTWIGIGVALCFLRIARGQDVDLDEIFAGGRYFLNVLLASIVFGLILGGVVLLCLTLAGVVAGVAWAVQREPAIALVAVIGGYSLALVPVIIVSLMFCMYQYLIIDRDAGIIESLSLSRQITSGNKLTMFGALLVVGLLGGLVVLFTCLLGLVVVGPYISILWVVLYLSMSGQATLADMRDAPSPV